MPPNCPVPTAVGVNRLGQMAERHYETVLLQQRHAMRVIEGTARSMGIDVVEG